MGIKQDVKEIMKHCDNNPNDGDLWENELWDAGIQYIPFDDALTTDLTSGILNLCNSLTEKEEEGETAFEWYYDITYLFYRFNKGIESEYFLSFKRAEAKRQKGFWS